MLNKAKYKFSIIVAVYNGVKTLSDCLNSVWKQNFKDYELIVIDGGSQDGTVDFINQNRQRISYAISEQDSGVYSAWNKAIRKVNGEWICFLGADDEFASTEVLANVAARIELILDEKYVYGSVDVVNNLGQVLETLGEPWENVKIRFLKIHCVPHTGSFHHRSLFVENSFDESFRIAGDYEFLLRYLRNGSAVFLNGITTVRMRVGGLSSRPENSFLNLEENRKAQIKNGVAGFFAAPIWYRMYVRVLVRFLLVKIFGNRLAFSILDFGRKLCGKQSYWSVLNDK